MQGLTIRGLTLCIKDQQDSHIEFTCGQHCGAQEAKDQQVISLSTQEKFESDPPCVDIEFELGECLVRRMDWGLAVDELVDFELRSFLPSVHSHAPSGLQAQKPVPDAAPLNLHHSIASTVLLI